MKEIYLAGGCFWGTEAFLSKLKGVEHTEVGYANGNMEDPTYELVCTGTTNFAETVKVVYDESVIGLSFLLSMYIQTVNPTSINRQGGDMGTQYRTGIYYTDEEDKQVILEFLSEVQNQYEEKIAIESKPLINYYKAEEYHQKYLEKNPNGYCHIRSDLFEMAKEASDPSQKIFKTKSKEELRRDLTSLQWEVTQNNGTERPFENEYHDNFKKGIYVDIASGEPLFSSSDKFDAGCGWPSFSKPIEDSSIEKVDDHSHHMVRIEVRTKDSNIHLGHVFDDGPKVSGGLRYCINSASLRFIPFEDMDKEGYHDYKKYIKEQ
ncbi:MAG TPA: peptide-methionine (R)-S-oxide reductase MsrB [Candidatus Merdenecus merdavium]|nr:peptide-methionine (R)-S-oxide reductase MsrB [Candidatus Merdenecus merdavium]